MRRADIHHEVSGPFRNTETQRKLNRVGGLYMKQDPARFGIGSFGVELDSTTPPKLKYSAPSAVENDRYAITGSTPDRSRDERNALCLGGSAGIGNGRGLLIPV